jgi:hypothetical protein
MIIQCIFETADGMTGHDTIEAEKIPMQINRPCKGWRKLDLKHLKRAKASDPVTPSEKSIPVRVYEFTRSDRGVYYYREVLR